MDVWLVKAPAMQVNGMMCSRLECKFEIKTKRVCMFADMTYNAACSLTASNKP